jgi:hypothetical protein
MMFERLGNLALDEGKWLPIAMLLAIVASTVAINRRLRHGSPYRDTILVTMNLFYGWMIGIMSLGHLLAVTIKVARGTLEGSMWFLYPLGLVLAIPAWCLAFRAGHLVAQGDRRGTLLAALNAWLGICLVALGLHNVPLAVPAAFNLAYQYHSRRTVGWAIVTVSVVTMMALFVGALVFLASGKSFEEFRGMV